MPKKRLDAGDISELEATSTEIDFLTAKATTASAVHDVVLAQERLRQLLGVNLPKEQLTATVINQGFSAVEDDEAVVAMALAMRPDLRALEIRKNAACQRLALAKKQFMSVEGGYDANSDGEQGFESGPALRLTLPIFNANRGQIAVAEAAVRQVDAQYFALRDQIELDVRTAIAQLRQASEQLDLFDIEILPTLQEAQELSQRNYLDGGVPYFLVLQTTSQFVDAQLRRADAVAVTRRATAELERSVGQRLPTETRFSLSGGREVHSESAILPAVEPDLIDRP